MNRLAIFDCDGTLVDGQASVCLAMERCFEEAGLPKPSRERSRRIRIDHPDGGRIDVTAELPAHFQETMANLGFDPALGDLPLDEIKFSETPEGKRKAATAAAKARRKERKGERRSRGRG